MTKNMRARSAGAATEESLRTRYLGRHTTLSYLFDNKQLWRHIPYLRENEGHAPPIVLAVGDRRRVYSISRRLNKAVLLPETAARRISKRDYRSAPEFGRIAMAIGLISSIPILVVETQMGSPATQIIMNETLSDDLTCLDYRVGRNRITLPHKIVIRVGTAGGINCEGKRPVNVGDIVVATHSIGVSGANLQSLHCLDFWRPAAIQGIQRVMDEHGRRLHDHGSRPSQSELQRRCLQCPRRCSTNSSEETLSRRRKHYEGLALR